MQMEKMAVLHWIFLDCGMLVGTMLSYMAGIREDQRPLNSSNTANNIEEDDNDNDGGAVLGDPTSSLFVVTLAAKSHMPLNHD